MKFIDWLGDNADIITPIAMSAIWIGFIVWLVSA